jgi:hypothetical protein
MLKLSCQCGDVRVTVSRLPGFVHECNCTLCSRTGARWAYYHPDEVVVSGATTSYQRRDRLKPGVTIHFCPTCGATTHFSLTSFTIAMHGDVQRGINMRLADERELDGVELRFPDGRAWSGSGAFDYVREPHILGR